MRLAYVLEHRFLGTPDGSVWTSTCYEEKYWDRYLTVFDRVLLVARVLPVNAPRPDWRRVNGHNVEVCRVPFYQGPWQFVVNQRAVQHAVHRAVRQRIAIILRVPSQLGLCASASASRDSHPFGVEVVGDPDQVFAPGVNRHPLRPLFRRWFVKGLRRQCLKACALSYVSQLLSHQYPGSESSFRTQLSDAELSDDAFCGDFGRAVNNGKPPVIITVGALDQHYKGTDVLLRAFQMLRAWGVKAKLVIVGDGRLRPSFEGLSRRLGVSADVVFTGEVPAGQPVRRQLDRATLFLLPSLTEGLSRALLEAMARGLPCVASAVGGTPEVLPEEDLVPAGDALSLATKIRDVLSSEARLRAMSRRNVETARRFYEERMMDRRRAFCAHVEACTRSWLKEQPLALSRK